MGLSLASWNNSEIGCQRCVCHYCVSLYRLALHGLTCPYVDVPGQYLGTCLALDPWQSVFLFMNEHSFATWNCVARLCFVELGMIIMPFPRCDTPEPASSWIPDFLLIQL